MELARNRDGAASPHRKPQEAALTAPAPGPLHWRRCDRASGLLGSGTRHPGGLASAVRIPVLWTPRAPPETPSLGSCRVGLVTSNGTVWGLGSGQDKQRHPLDPPSHLAPGAIASKAGPNPGRYDDPGPPASPTPMPPPPFPDIPPLPTPPVLDDTRCVSDGRATYTTLPRPPPTRDILAYRARARDFYMAPGRNTPLPLERHKPAAEVVSR